MPRILLLSAILGAFILAGAPTASADVFVRGYTRKDGTVVRSHYRSNPDGNRYNNWSTRGNVNPHTGVIGTRNVDNDWAHPPTGWAQNTYSRKAATSGPIVLQSGGRTLVHVNPTFEEELKAAKQQATFDETLMRARLRLYVDMAKSTDPSLRDMGLKALGALDGAHAAAASPRKTIGDRATSRARRELEAQSRAWIINEIATQGAALSSAQIEAYWAEHNRAFPEANRAARLFQAATDNSTE